MYLRAVTYRKTRKWEWRKEFSGRNIVAFRDSNWNSGVKYDLNFKESSSEMYVGNNWCGRMLKR